MASETTELTFVRCPSCRSLVPASAARCRICNSPLESSAKSEESEASKGASRVRQNTMSADPNEVAAAIASAHAENAGANGENGGNSTPPKVEATPVASTPTSLISDPVSVAPASSAQDDAFDPLSAYLEEMDEVIEEPSVGASATVEDPLGLTAGLEEKSEDPSVVSLLADLEDEGDSWGVPPTEKQVTKGETSHSPTSVESTPHATSADTPPGHTEQKSPPSSGAREERRGQPNPGFPRGGEERRGASGGMPRPERGGESRNDQRNNEQRAGEPRPQKDRPQSMFGGPQPRKEERREERKDERREAQRQNERRDERRDEKRDERRENEPREKSARPEESRQQQPRQGEKQQSRSPETQKSENSKLFGWLVSFKSPEGRAIELRQGRFFVTASSIKSSDLVIDHESISTPHSLMLVHQDRGVMVQDLMSEHGVFIRRGDSGEYKQEEGTIPLRHGDWLKFGKVEYLVALLPYAQK